MGTDTLFPLPIDDAAVEFFYRHHAWGPGEARMGSARNLAEAEAYAKAHGWTAEWERDYDSVDDEWADWPQYLAIVRDGAGDSIQGCGGVMFKDKGDETSDPYARVVVAELYAEAMREHLWQLEREASR